MIASMTGFARQEVITPAGTLVCELRSVNHRYLEASFRLPEELRSLEPELRAAITRDLRRGKVDCSVQLRAAQAAERALQIDATALEQLLQRLSEVAATTERSRLGAQAHVELLDLLRWPGVMRDPGTGGEPLLAAGRAVVDAALRDLAAARLREGARLAELLEQRCATLATLVANLRVRLPEVVAGIRTRMEERLAELRVQVDRERLDQEIAMILQRMDVAEELDRLDGHIAETRRVLAAPEAAGRRLDFLMQELNREANTLSSKSQDLETTRTAVDMKVAIEQMREQVQNVE